MVRDILNGNISPGLAGSDAARIQNASGKDRTVSLNGRVYEIDALLVGQRVVLRSDRDAPPSRPFDILHHGKPTGKATRLDAYANNLVKRGHYPNKIEPDDPAPEPPPSPLSLRNFKEDD